MGRALDGGKYYLEYILIVSRTGTFVNRFYTSREDTIPLFDLWVLKILISSFVDSML